MKSIKVHNHAPSTRRATLPDHEHSARRARAKTLGLPRKSKPTPPAAKSALFLSHRLAQPDLGTFD
ncbi:MAG TPA: hypothetical protein VGU25_00795 [Acidobacteriaceae bacterium]|nr:hypothetical protein [Acidobacteriaceae bacterium]